MTEVEIEHENWTVKAEIEWKYAGKSGIGHYEFQGQSGFDEGFDEYEVEEITLTEIIDPDGNRIPISELSKDQTELFMDLVNAETAELQP